MAIEATLNAIKVAGFRVIMASEFDQDYWIVNLAKNRKAEMKDWKAGRGKTLGQALETALAGAVGKRAPKPKPSFDPLEDI